jgi:cephalosporin hydroxylase
MVEEGKTLRITIDTDCGTVGIRDCTDEHTMQLYSKQAFELLSQLWLKLSWEQKYSYTFTWLGRPIIQHPEDVLRLQEVLYVLQPDVIIETGVAHGGSLVFYASLMKAWGHGRVVGVDVEIRPHNRAEIEAHPLAPLITLIEGDSIAPETVEQVRAMIKPSDIILVILDSNHTRAHVLGELEAYSALVSVGSWIVATDGIMRDLYDVPRGRPEWRENNPVMAAQDFLSHHPEFVLEPPRWLFNESPLDRPITAWPDAWLKRMAA